jgi:long-chain acyl-CoA synthetase
VKKVANGIYHLFQESGGLSEEELNCVSIFAINRPEWWITDLACNYHSLATVGLFDTFGPEAFIYILNQTKSPIVVTSIDKIPYILAQLSKLEHLKHIVCMDPLPKGSPGGTLPHIMRSWAATVPISLMDYEELMDIGAKNSYPFHLPDPESVTTLCYTSGTTGKPKGVIITHKNLMVSSYSVFTTMRDLLSPDPASCSYMPLSHCYERAIQCFDMWQGGKVGFYTGDVTMLLEDIQMVKPTGFCSVPRLLNRMYDSIAAKTIRGSGIVSALFKVAIHTKMEHYKKTGETMHSFWDKTLFSKTKAILGGRAKYVISGSAPLPKQTLEFLRMIFACDVRQGYGLSETMALVSVQPAFDKYTDHVGPPFAHNEIKLVSVSEMNYSVNDKPFPRGEVLVRGPNVCKGYFKRPELNETSFDDEGFYKTGDIGYIDNHGYLFLIDRKSSLFKLSQGEFISPERIESALLNHPAVMTAWVTGDRTKNYPVAVIVPDPEAFNNWINNSFGGSKSGELESLCQDKEISSKLLQELKEISKQEKLAG